MAILPQPDVTAEVTPPQQDGVPHTVDVVVSRDGKARSYHGSGSTTAGSVADVVKRMLDDPHTAEYVRKG